MKNIIGNKAYQNAIYCFFNMIIPNKTKYCQWDYKLKTFCKKNWKNALG